MNERQLLDKLPGIKVHRIQETPLAFGEQQIKRQRALARPADPGHDDKFVPWNRQRDVFQIMLARAMNDDGFRLDIQFRFQ